MADSFTVTWFNRLDQLGYCDLTLTIDHDQKIIPPYRVIKTYETEDPAAIDEPFLATRAQEEIAFLVDQWNSEGGK